MLASGVASLRDDDVAAVGLGLRFLFVRLLGLSLFVGVALGADAVLERLLVGVGVDEALFGLVVGFGLGLGLGLGIGVGLGGVGCGLGLRFRFGPRLRPDRGVVDLDGLFELADPLFGLDEFLREAVDRCLEFLRFPFEFLHPISHAH